jgi:membrane protein
VALEYGPILAFVLCYLVVREESYTLGGREWDGFVLLVGGFVPLVLASGLVMWRRSGRISPIQVLTLIIMALSGGLTVGFNDERYFKMRTTVVCLTLSGILWVGLWRGRSWLAGVMGGMVTLSPAGWRYLTRRFATVLLVLAAANEAVWRNLSTDAWVAYDTFVMPAAFFGYLGWKIRRARELWRPTAPVRLGGTAVAAAEQGCRRPDRGSTRACSGRPTMRRRSKRTWELLKDTMSLWSSRHAFQFAGAMAFYTVFSLAPLMILLVSAAGIFFGEEAARGELAAQLDSLVGSQAAEALQSAVERSSIEESGLLPTVLGVIALLFGATTVFAQVQAALNNLWEVKSHPSRSGALSFLRTRLLSLGLILAIGFLLLVSFALSVSIGMVVRFASHWVPVPNLLAFGANLTLTLVVVTLLFATVYKVLPDVHPGWRDMWMGAFGAATLFAVGQYAISYYLIRTAPGSAYGAAGSLVIVLMWVYYSSLILLFGAAFTRIAVRERGEVVRPRDIAVRVRTVIVEEGGDPQA